MKTLFAICFLFIAISGLQAQDKTIIAKYKEAACNDAACECNACYYTFVTDKGEEIVFNSILAENPDYTLIFTEVDGTWETNKANVGKKFRIVYKEENCQCMGSSDEGEPSPVDVPTRVMLFFALN
jgi:hypothetical protein